MMTLVARLCALCAVCALGQLILGDARDGDGFRMISGLLMLHLVISGGYALSVRLAGARSLESIFEVLIK